MGGAALLILAGPSAWINRAEFFSNRIAVFVGLTQLSVVFVALADSVVWADHSRGRTAAQRKDCRRRSELLISYGDVALRGISYTVR